MIIIVCIIVLTLLILLLTTHSYFDILLGIIIFGVSIITLYTISAIYHGLSPKLKAKKVLQVLDHCMIFLLIAGSYTPFAIEVLRTYDPAVGWIIFSVVWILAIIGVVLNSIDLKKFRVVSMICYMVMGWCIIFKISILPGLLGMPGFILLLVGGIIYTIGAILFGIGKKIKWMHSIFHICCVLATTLHFICIMICVV
jgi:hemolysin III